MKQQESSEPLKVWNSHLSGEVDHRNIMLRAHYKVSLIALWIPLANSNLNHTQHKPLHDKNSIYSDVLGLLIHPNTQIGLYAFQEHEPFSFFCLAQVSHAFLLWRGKKKRDHVKLY